MQPVGLLPVFYQYFFTSKEWSIVPNAFRKSRKKFMTFPVFCSRIRSLGTGITLDFLGCLEKLPERKID